MSDTAIPLDFTPRHQKVDRVTCPACNAVHTKAHAEANKVAFAGRVCGCGVAPEAVAE